MNDYEVLIKVGPLTVVKRGRDLELHDGEHIYIKSNYLSR